MRKLPRRHSRASKEALQLLGLQIRLSRKSLRMSEAELAERAGIARSTLQKIEKGDPFVEIGLVFEAATLAGVSLFEAERSGLAAKIERTEDKLALLPKSVRRSRAEPDDAF